MLEDSDRPAPTAADPEQPPQAQLIYPPTGNY
jgi:hypothetical protein